MPARQLILWLGSISLLGCFHQPVNQTSTLRIKGSDTMLVLMENLAQGYMMSHPNMSIYIEGGGTASGINALIEGDINICAASRLLLPEESRRVSQKYESVGFLSRIAKDALSIYVHPDNPIKDFSLKQLKMIFSGQIKNWREIGGQDREIVVLIRPPNSGTYQYFKEHILQEQSYYSNALTIPTTQRIVDEVLQNIAAVGYGGIAYGPEIIHCQVNGISPSPDNVRFDLYPISRYLYLYTLRKPQNLEKEFIDWIMSTDGQKIVQETGYIPIWSVE